MRFLMVLIPRDGPAPQLVARLPAYDEQLTKAGVLLLALDGRGARIWILETRTRAEAVEWARRMPAGHDAIELRAIFEMEEFGEMVFNPSP
jgi:hypothetical protein